MKNEDIHWGDWHRILIGSAPETFLPEVFEKCFHVPGFAGCTLCDNCGDIHWVDAVL